METRTYEIKKLDEEGVEVLAYTWDLKFENNLLIIHRVTVVEEETIRDYVASQPHRTNPDGTTQPWESAEDAFQWFVDREEISL